MDQNLQGWHPDPFGIHEYRYFSGGDPTFLVRDAGRETRDPVPAHLPTHQPQAAMATAPTYPPRVVAPPATPSLPPPPAPVTSPLDPGQPSGGRRHAVPRRRGGGRGSSRPTRVLIIACVLAVVAVVVGIVVGTSGGGKHAPVAAPTTAAAPPRNVTPPARIAQYTRAAGNVANRLRPSLVSAAAQLHLPISAFATAPAAGYATTAGGPATLYFQGVAITSGAVPAEIFQRGEQTQFITAVLSGAGITATRSFIPGPLGGQESCGTGKQGKATITGCAWADSGTAGVLLSTAPTSLPLFSTFSVEFRAAAER